MSYTFELDVWKLTEQTNKLVCSCSCHFERVEINCCNCLTNLCVCESVRLEGGWWGTGQEPLFVLQEGDAFKSVDGQQTLIGLEYTQMRRWTHAQGHTGVNIQTQVRMEKKQKAMVARAASEPWANGSSSGEVACH